MRLINSGYSTRRRVKPVHDEVVPAVPKVVWVCQGRNVPLLSPNDDRYRMSAQLIGPTRYLNR